LNPTVNPKRPISRGVLLLVLLLAMAIRLYNIDMPFVERFNNISRQAMCASVARNYWKDGFNLFKPALDQGGPGFNLYNVELPLNTYIMSWGYALASGAHEGVARSVSVAFSLLLMLFLFLLFRRWFDSHIAIWSILFLSISPMSVALSRSIQPDIAMLAFMVMGIYFFDRHLRSSSFKELMVSALLIFAAVLTRPFALYILLLLAVMALFKYGIKALRMPKYYFYVFLISLGLIWYVVMWRIGLTRELPFNPYKFSRGEMIEGQGYWNLFDFESLRLNIKVLVLHILTPLGVPLFLWGLVTFRRIKEHALIWAWTVATLIYLLIMWPTAVYHPYYLLPLLPCLAYFFAIGVRQWFSSAWGGWMLKVKWPLVILCLLQALCVGYYYQLLYTVPAQRMAIVQTGQIAEKLIPREDLVVASWGASPIQLYYCNRKGWPLSSESNDTEALIAQLDEYRERGAKWYITSTTSEISINNEFINHLRTTHTLRSETPETLIFEL
jgi:4-amino-4-deoxy-L-arabinose transferase-like glycosyltransferase